MGSVTVAPVSKYLLDSALSSPDDFANLSNVKQTSINLTDTSLWLVDKSVLKSITSNTDQLQAIAPSVTKPVLTENVLQVPFENIRNEASPIKLDNAFASVANEYSAITLPQNDSLQMAAFRGNVQLASASLNNNAAAMGGVVTGTTIQSDFGQSALSTAGGTLNSSGLLASNAVQRSTSSTSSLTVQPLSTDLDASNSTQTSSNTTLASGNITQNSTDATKPVPFEFSQTLGLLLVFGAIAVRKMLKRDPKVAKASA